MKKIILILLLITSISLPQSSKFWKLAVLMNEEGLAPYPKTDDLVASYDEDEMTVSSWADQTGSNDFLQATETNQPSLISNALSSYPALRFDGADNYMAIGTFVLNQPFTIYMVVKQISWTDGDKLFYSGSGALIAQGGGATGLLYMFAGGYEPRKNLGIGSYKIASCVFNGASSEFGANGIDTLTNNVGSTRLSGSLRMCWGGLADYGNFEVAALYIHSTAHDLATRTQIVNWLNDKYNIY